MPISDITSIAAGWTLEASKPALVTLIFPLPLIRANPSAIWDRQEFFLQTKMTFFI
jgi:hypothetical protein